MTWDIIDIRTRRIVNKFDTSDEASADLDSRGDDYSNQRGRNAPRYKMRPTEWRRDYQDEDRLLPIPL